MLTKPFRILALALLALMSFGAIAAEKEYEEELSFSFTANSGDCPGTDTEAVALDYELEWQAVEVHAYASRKPAGLDCSKVGQTVDLYIERNFTLPRGGIDVVGAFGHVRASQVAVYVDGGGGEHAYNVGTPASFATLGFGKTYRGVELTIGANVLEDDYGDWTARIDYERPLLGGELGVEASTLAGNRSAFEVSWGRGLLHVALRREVGRNYVPVPMYEGEDDMYMLKEGPEGDVTELRVGIRFL